jgi:hypothetical protein
VGARRVGDGDGLDGPGDELVLVPAIVLEHGIGVVVRPAAGGVGEELIDGDVGDVGFVDAFGAVLVAEDAAGAEDLVVEVKLALLDEREDGGGGDGLGDAGDAEDAVSVGEGGVVAVGDSVGFVEDKLPVAGDGDGERGIAELTLEFGDEAVDLAALCAGELVAVAALGSEWKGEERCGGRSGEAADERAAREGVGHARNLTLSRNLLDLLEEGP